MVGVKEEGGGGEGEKASGKLGGYIIMEIFRKHVRSEDVDEIQSRQIST